MGISPGGWDIPGTVNMSQLCTCNLLLSFLVHRLPWLRSPPTPWPTSMTQNSSWQLIKPLWLSPSSTCSSFLWPCSRSSSPVQCRPASLSSDSASSSRTKNWIRILWNGIQNHLQVHKSLESSFSTTNPNLARAQSILESHFQWALGDCDIGSS